MIVLSHPSDCLRSNAQFHIREDLHVYFAATKVRQDYFDPRYLALSCPVIQYQ